LKQRSSVDFPQPLGPMMAVTRFLYGHVDPLQRVAFAIVQVEVFHAHGHLVGVFHVFTRQIAHLHRVGRSRHSVHFVFLHTG